MVIWFIFITNFSTEMKKQIDIYNKIEGTVLADTIFFFLYFSSVIFKKNHVFNEEDNPSKKLL